MIWTVQQLKALAVQAGLDADRASIAAAIAMAESGGDDSTWNDKPGETPAGQHNCVSVGLWQINCCPGRDDGNPDRNAKAMLNPQANARSMMAISGNGTSWSAWSVYRQPAGHPAYLNFLDAAKAASANPVGDALSGNGPGGLVGALGDLGAGGGGLPNPLDALASIGDFFTKLLSWETWKRILYVGFGLGALAIGIYLVTKDTGPDASSVNATLHRNPQHAAIADTSGATNP